LNPSEAVPFGDGRHERSRTSRAKIIAALLKRVEDGDTTPSAASVAKLAGVGISSVFRLFADMDALYREMVEHIEAKVLPSVFTMPEGNTWKERMISAFEARAKVFETILPYRAAANHKRFDSDYLMDDFKRVMKLERDTVETHLPPSVLKDKLGTDALNVILGFQTWQRLRKDEALSFEDTRALIRRMLDDALAALPED
jgi:AcrR family transcriptional regulator